MAFNLFCDSFIDFVSFFLHFLSCFELLNFILNLLKSSDFFMEYMFHVAQFIYSFCFELYIFELFLFSLRFY